MFIMKTNLEHFDNDIIALCDEELIDQKTAAMIGFHA